MQQKREDMEIDAGQILGVKHVFRIYLDNVLKHTEIQGSPRTFTSVTGKQDKLKKILAKRFI